MIIETKKQIEDRCKTCGEEVTFTRDRWNERFTHKIEEHREFDPKKRF